MSDPKICFDRLVAADLSAAQTTGAAILKAKRWDNGATLSVRFLEGNSDQKDQVKRYAVGWSKYANINFDFNDSRDAEIRISFDPALGAWSFLGKDNLTIDVPDATMNLGWVDEGVILHEFGHAIGLIHEHQNPEGGIQWDKAAVIDSLSKPPNSWSLSTIEHNMFKKYDKNLINGTALDKKSIMMYAFPNAWTIGDFQTTENNVLSDQDKAFIASDGGYPGR